MSRKDCNVCHTQNPADAKWCRNCGRMFPQDKMPNEKTNENRSANKKPVFKKTNDKKKKLWLLFLVPVMIFAVVCLISYIRLSSFDVPSSWALLPSGGSEDFYIDSHGCSYWAYSKPSWVEITSKTSYRLYIKYEGNNSGVPRSGHIKIQAMNWLGSKDYSIYVHQGYIPNPSATLSNVWTSYNAYRNGEKGMIIHLDFLVYNMKDKTGKVIANFYRGTTTPLYDSNYQYRTDDGKVGISKKITPTYDPSKYTDLELFMPYNEFHITSYGEHELSYAVQIIDNKGNAIARSNRQYFTYTVN